MNIVIDTREKYPLDFFGHEITRIKLDEGDYCTLDLLEYEKSTGEKTVRIERKRNTGELSINLGKDFKRFENELSRLFSYKRKVLLCEFTYDDILSFPENSGIPKSRWYRKSKSGKVVRNVKMTPKDLLNKLEYIENIYEIEIIYAGDSYNAAQKAEDILNDFEKEVKR